MNELKHSIEVIKQAIERSRYRALKTANSELLSLYYGIGKYVSENTRSGKWGTDAIRNISKQLQIELPGLRGFSETNIKYMRLFYENWNEYVNRQPMADDLEVDSNMLITLIRQPSADELDWNKFLAIPFSHHIEILTKTSSIEERKFYIYECALNAWNKYTLRDYIKSGLFQNKTLISNNFSNTLTDTKYVIKATKTFKDNYLLDFINIENLGESDEDVDERVIEYQIINNIKDFLIRFGKDFIFIGNQYKIEYADEEMFVDLLFFNRELNCLVAVELKTGKFKPSYLGQLNTYLSVLDDKVKKPHENQSIGIILCRDMNKTFVDYVIRDYDKPLGVATYKTSKDMSDELRRALPNIEDLRKLLETNE